MANRTKEHIAREEALFSKTGPKSRKIFCIDTGETFSSAREAANELGLSESYIYAHLRGEKASVKGLHFAYEE